MGVQRPSFQRPQTAAGRPMRPVAPICLLGVFVYRGTCVFTFFPSLRRQRHNRATESLRKARRARGCYRGTAISSRCDVTMSNLRMPHRWDIRPGHSDITPRGKLRGIWPIPKEHKHSPDNPMSSRRRRRQRRRCCNFGVGELRRFAPVLYSA